MSLVFKNWLELAGILCLSSMPKQIFGGIASCTSILEMIHWGSGADTFGQGGPSDVVEKENASTNFPTCPNYAQLAPPQPSESWLKNPAWIDGSVNPPQFYYSDDEIMTVLKYYQPDHPALEDPIAAMDPTPPCAPARADDLPPNPVVVPHKPIATSRQPWSWRYSSLLFSAIDKTKLGKLTMKKQSNSKFNIIALEDLNHSAFIHEAEGSVGGKKGVTIENDREYMVMIEAILKKAKTCQPLLAHDTEDTPELQYGTKQDQLHSEIILELKQKWPCEWHQGEHGEVGFCYVDPTGNHLGLNHCKLAMWASAIAAHDATKHEPPNNIHFNTLCDATPPPDSTSALMPALIAHLIPKPPAAPVETPAPTTPRKPKPLITPTPVSPIPSRSAELHTCLADFLKTEDVNLLHSEAVLAALNLTPGIIPDVPVPHLIEVTGAHEGHLWKLQAFCQSWNTHLAEKKLLAH
ncbi:uncharacterized protein LACBIDRAFT_328512 [Laccaria bicolor S238N-H82]|uniref:Predicted protein n=1 Tax=Laccaria bicolor (strain S238N-H82 / ATCC MYA-4686) TaxID=486041 RepID=B0DF32_LACBS|nr:uncharacterized protein LACBIDRAFT_328512 [Laccaria bicolor S238N-H82]EDR06779.1 predicted protein [Laccaria bicolor S238N-H82]|eukprot:XP_001882626.1 predicted protein [Laccaria bicolor S238N-H82]